MCWPLYKMLPILQTLSPMAPLLTPRVALTLLVSEGRTRHTDRGSRRDKTLGEEEGERLTDRVLLAGRTGGGDRLKMNGVTLFLALIAAQPKKTENGLARKGWLLLRVSTDPVKPITALQVDRGWLMLGVGLVELPRNIVLLVVMLWWWKRMDM